MSVAFDVGGSTQNGASGTTTTLNFTISGGSNRVLLVGYYGETPSAIDWNGTPITTLEQSIDYGGGILSLVYSLIAPESGSHTLTITHPSGRPGLQAASFTGVDQTTPVNHLGSNAFNDVSPQSASITVDTGGMAFALFQVVSNATDAAPNGGATSVSSSTNVSGDSEVASSYLANATTMGFTWTVQGGSDIGSVNVTALKPATDSSAAIDVDGVATVIFSGKSNAKSALSISGVGAASFAGIQQGATNLNTAGVGSASFVGAGGSASFLSRVYYDMIISRSQ